MTTGRTDPSADGADRPLTIAEMLRQRHEDLTPAERKIARLLTAQYPLPGLDTVARLAARAGVSAPTVIRLVEKLGFESYADFQDTLKAELGERLSSPLAMYSDYRHSDTDGIDGVLHRAIDTFSDGIRASLTRVPPGELLAAVNLLADQRRPVVTIGGRFSDVLARCLASHLQEVRPHAVHLPDAPSERAAALLDIGRKSTVVVFDYRRYQWDTIRFGEVAKRQGATLVLFTDPWLSPLASKADIVLQATVTAPSPFDSMVAALALVEALVAALVDRLGEQPRPRLQRFDALTQGVTAGLVDTGM
jgi:DNA-binding MurR/RpiR family transcriptional regulator